MNARTTRVQKYTLKSGVHCGQHFLENKIFCANCVKMLVPDCIKYSLYCYYLFKKIIIACGIGKINMKSKLII